MSSSLVLRQDLDVPGPGGGARLFASAAAVAFKATTDSSTAPTVHFLAIKFSRVLVSLRLERHIG